MAEELHRGADDVVAPLDQQRRGHRRIHAARHRHQNAITHRQLATVDSPRARSTSAGNTSATRSTSLSVLSAPRLMRIAADASSGFTPIALNTCDGLTLPL